MQGKWIKSDNLHFSIGAAHAAPDVRDRCLTGTQTLPGRKCTQTREQEGRHITGAIRMCNSWFTASRTARKHHCPTAPLRHLLEDTSERGPDPSC